MRSPLQKEYEELIEQRRQGGRKPSSDYTSPLAVDRCRAAGCHVDAAFVPLTSSSSESTASTEAASGKVVQRILTQISELMEGVAAASAPAEESSGSPGAREAFVAELAARTQAQGSGVNVRREVALLEQQGQAGRKGDGVDTGGGRESGTEGSMRTRARALDGERRESSSSQEPAKRCAAAETGLVTPSQEGPRRGALDAGVAGRRTRSLVAAAEYDRQQHHNPSSGQFSRLSDAAVRSRATKQEGVATSGPCTDLGTAAPTNAGGVAAHLAASARRELLVGADPLLEPPVITNGSESHGVREKAQRYVAIAALNIEPLGSFCSGRRPETYRDFVAFFHKEC
jgi:hypothetical protein